MDGGTLVLSILGAVAVTALWVPRDQAASTATVAAHIEVDPPVNAGPGSSNRSGAERVTVPRLVGLRLEKARQRAHARNLRLTVVTTHSDRRRGVVIDQEVPPGERVMPGTMTVTASDGPPPVVVPALEGRPVADAQDVLARAGLHVEVRSIQSRRPAGVVVDQSPRDGTEALRGSIVELLVAAEKEWRTVTAFTTRADAASEIFRIQGSRWRIAYTVSYERCNEYLGCDAPTLTVEGHGGTTGYEEFTLGEGAHTTAVPLEPGRYSIRIDNGFDSVANVSVRVEEWS